jgi:hypothetical protein
MLCNMSTTFVGIVQLAQLTGLSLFHLRNIKNELPRIQSGRRLLFDPEQVSTWLRDRATAAATPTRMAVTNMATDPHGATPCACLKKNRKPCKNFADRIDDAGRPVCHFHDPKGTAQAREREKAERRRRMSGGGL